MANYLLCFSNKRFKVSADILIQSANKFGIKNVVHKTFDQFKDTTFYKQHLDICQEPFGAGFYVWKPYYILEVLEQLNDDDIIFYVDAGHVLMNDPAPLYQIAADKEMVFFTNEQGLSFISATQLAFNYHNFYREINTIKFWTKGDALGALDGNKPEIWDYPSVDASLMLFKKNYRTIEFCKEWLYHCSSRANISWDKTSGEVPDRPEFIRHIYDQSILSIMVAQRRIELFRCPSQFGNHRKMRPYRRGYEYCALTYDEQPMENSPYPTITYHHRTKTKSFRKRVADFIIMELLMLNHSFFCGNSRLIKWLLKKESGVLLGINKF